MQDLVKRWRKMQAKTHRLRNEGHITEEITLLTKWNEYFESDPLAKTLIFDCNGNLAQVLLKFLERTCPRPF